MAEQDKVAESLVTGSPSIGVHSAGQHVEVVDSHDRSDTDTSQMLQHPELRKGTTG